jgi:hypothetical protein
MLGIVHFNTTFRELALIQSSSDWLSFYWRVLLFFFKISAEYLDRPQALLIVG